MLAALQSLKEFYEDQRGRYESPTELEMRVYHRLIHIRDQKERHEDIPNHITAHPVFKLTTDFRRHVQQKSAPISKTSPLVVDAEAMAIFGRLAAVLGEQGSVVMIYLVACILERLFGKETVEDIEAIRGELTVSDVIDGISTDAKADDSEMNEMEADDWREDATEPQQVSPLASLEPSSNSWLSSSFTAQPLPPIAPPTAPPVAASAFAGLVSTPNVFGTPSIFGDSVFSNLNQPSTSSVFDTQRQVVFGGPPVSNSISIVPTPVAAINFTPSAIPGESDIINGISTNNKTDDRKVDETEELEPDDWEEDVTEPQQVSPPAEFKQISNGWLSSSLTSQPSSAPAPVAPVAPPLTTPAFTGLVSTPNIFDIPSIFGNSAFSALMQPPTSTVSDTQPPQVGFGGPIASTSIPVLPTPATVSINPAPSAVRRDSTGPDITGDISTADDRVVNEVDATEADDWQEDATEPQQVSLLTPLKPTLNGSPSSSLTSQPSTSTTPTTQQQPLTNGTKRISTTAFASGESNSPPTQRKRVRRRISSRYHLPLTDEDLVKRFKEVQSVLVACFSTTFNGPDGFSFFPSWLSFDAYIYIFSRNMKNTSFAGLKDPSFKSYENTSKCAVRPRSDSHGRYGYQ